MKYYLGNPYVQKYNLLLHQPNRKYETPYLSVAVFIKMFYDMRVGNTSETDAEYIYLPGILKLTRKVNFGKGGK
jgi:hypothetical protein